MLFIRVWHGGFGAQLANKVGSELNRRFEDSASVKMQLSLPLR